MIAGCAIVLLAHYMYIQAWWCSLHFIVHTTTTSAQLFAKPCAFFTCRVRSAACSSAATMSSKACMRFWSSSWCTSISSDAACSDQAVALGVLSVVDVVIAGFVAVEVRYHKPSTRAAMDLNSVRSIRRVQSRRLDADGGFRARAIEGQLEGPDPEARGGPEGIAAARAPLGSSTETPPRICNALGGLGWPTCNTASAQCLKL